MASPGRSPGRACLLGRWYCLVGSAGTNQKVRVIQERRKGVMVLKEVIQTKGEIDTSLDSICQQMLDRHSDLSDTVLVGIRTGGVFLAERLRERILKRKGVDVPTGTIDITLYRDDWTQLSQAAEVKKTDIRFPIEGKQVLLVDDVLFTGRTIRAALDALLDHGRPQRIELAILVDRGHRELPICADYVGSYVKTSKEDSINVELKELAGTNQVIIEYGKHPSGDSGTRK